MQQIELRLKKIAAVIMGLALLGLLDSGYLTAHKLFGTPLKCGVSSGCETVAQSSYSSVFGVPLSLIGMLFYVAVFFGALIYREFGIQKVLRAVAFLTMASALVSLWLVTVQLFIIHAICIYCMLSAALSLILITLGFMILQVPQNPTPRTSAPSPLPDAGGSG